MINNGTYTAVTEMWLGRAHRRDPRRRALAVHHRAPGPRSAHPLVAARHLRGFAEFWGYMLVVSTFVFLLARLV